MRFEGCVKCDGLAVRLGLCADHYREWMGEIWERLLLEGETRPLPACWSGDEEAWREYQVLARASNNKLRSHCADCRPEFKNKMLGAGKCDRPETIFVRRRFRGEEEVVGLNREHPEAFSNACRGRDGVIVHDAPKVAKSVALAACDLRQWGWAYELADRQDETDSGDDLLPPMPPDQGVAGGARDGSGRPADPDADRDDEQSPD